MIFQGRNPHAGNSQLHGPVPEKKEGTLRVGGQAVIEGVMMRSPNSMAIAVRKPNGEIVVKREGLNFFSEKMFFSKFPLVRGILALFSALVLGMRALNFSANQALSEEEKAPSSWTMGFTFTVALSFGVFLFFLVPLFLTRWLRFAIPGVSDSGMVFNLVDGIIRLIIFLAYLWGISFLKDIQRIFQYHGAEHKSIFAFEAGEELIIDRVKGFGFLHPRCGTSFLSDRDGGEHLSSSAFFLTTWLSDTRWFPGLFLSLSLRVSRMRSSGSPIKSGRTEASRS